MKNKNRAKVELTKFDNFTYLIFVDPARSSGSSGEVDHNVDE